MLRFLATVLLAKIHCNGGDTRHVNEPNTQGIASSLLEAYQPVSHDVYMNKEPGTQDTSSVVRVCKNSVRNTTDMCYIGNCSIAFTNPGRTSSALTASTVAEIDAQLNSNITVVCMAHIKSTVLGVHRANTASGTENGWKDLLLIRAPLVGQPWKLKTPNNKSPVNMVRPNKEYKTMLSAFILTPRDTTDEVATHYISETANSPPHDQAPIHHKFTHIQRNTSNTSFIQGIKTYYYTAATTLVGSTTSTHSRICIAHTCTQNNDSPNHTNNSARLDKFISYAVFQQRNDSSTAVVNFCEFAHKAAVKRLATQSARLNFRQTRMRALPHVQLSKAANHTHAPTYTCSCHPRISDNISSILAFTALPAVRSPFQTSLQRSECVQSNTTFSGTESSLVRVAGTCHMSIQQGAWGNPKKHVDANGTRLTFLFGSIVVRSVDRSTQHTDFKSQFFSSRRFMIGDKQLTATTINLLNIFGVSVSASSVRSPSSLFRIHPGNTGIYISTIVLRQWREEFLDVHSPYYKEFSEEFCKKLLDVLVVNIPGRNPQRCRVTSFNRFRGRVISTGTTILPIRVIVVKSEVLYSSEDVLDLSKEYLKELMEKAMKENDRLSFSGYFKAGFQIDDIVPSSIEIYEAGSARQRQSNWVAHVVNVLLPVFVCQLL